MNNGYDLITNNETTYVTAYGIATRFDLDIEDVQYEIDKIADKADTIQVVFTRFDGTDTKIFYAVTEETAEALIPIMALKNSDDMANYQDEMELLKDQLNGHKWGNVYYDISALSNCIDGSLYVCTGQQ